MDIYKKAAQDKLRVQTSKGSLSVEQIFDLSVTELDKLAVSLQEESDSSAKKSFLVKRSVKDSAAKLRFDIVFDILVTKAAAADAAAEKAINKEKDQKILNILKDKEEAALSNLSEAELRKLLSTSEA